MVKRLRVEDNGNESFSGELACSSSRRCISSAQPNGLIEQLPAVIESESGDMDAQNSGSHRPRADK
jgi:hypothetical protein